MPTSQDHPLQYLLPAPLHWRAGDDWVVITGGLGFIGSCLANFFMACGQPVLLVDAPRDDKWLNITARKRPYLLSALPIGGAIDGQAVGDSVGQATPPLLTPEQLLALDQPHYQGRSITAMVHLGAVNDTNSSDEKMVLAKNTHYSTALWGRAAAWHLPFLYASSASTYGDGAAGFAEPQSLADIKKLRPLNLYGRSKQLFDEMVLAGHKDAPPFFAGLKFFNVYGPNEYHKQRQASVIPQFYRQAMTERRVRLFASTTVELADGMQERDFLWVMDAVWVMVRWLQLAGVGDHAAADNGKKISGIYNVGSGRATSFLAVAHGIIGHLPPPYHDSKIEFIPTPPDLVRHYQNHTRADIIGLSQLLGFQPTAIEKGIDLYVKQFLLPAP